MSLIKDTRRPIEKIITATMLLAFCFGLSSIISTTPVSATNTFTINIDNSIALRVLDKTGETAITTFALPLAAAPRGTFTSDYFNVEVSSANAFGYRLFMSTDYQAGSPAAYTTDLVNVEDSSVSVSTLASKDVAKSDFSRPSGSYVNSWGYSLDNTTFNPVPDHTTSQVIKFQKQEINRDLVPVYIGANVDSSKNSGIYRNVLTFSALGNLPATGYTLYFDAGTTDPVDNLPATMTAEEQSATHTFTIPSTAPTRERYTFTGYRDIETGTLYQAGDTITVAGNEQFVGSVELSAQWKVTDITTISTMQEMTSTLCANTAEHVTASLTDTRDDETYTVAKLKDGYCWMTQNLRLVGPLTITSSNSDIASGKSFSVPASTDPSVTPWCTEDAASCTDKAIMYDSGNSDYGAYYNWYTATASSGTYDTPTPPAIVQESICPKGWRLPSTFGSITSKYTTLAELTTSPVNLQLAGGISSSGKMQSQGQQAYYWTRYKLGASEQFARNARILWLRTEPESISATAHWGLLKGLSVRCIAR